MHIDFHAHILPGADHGSSSLETSLQQVELARQAGIDVLAATSHFYPKHESLSGFLERRTESEHRLREALPENAPKILVAAEVTLCRGMEEIDGLEQLCFPGTDVLLMELPRDFSIRAYEQSLDILQFERKLNIVLAHIDRYSDTVVDFLLDLGFLAQINAESFCRWRTRRRSMAWATELESVVALGSDMHGCDTGYRDFLKMKEKLGEAYDLIMGRTQRLLKL
ncbi:MAG: hypothetical protein IJG45_08780 [Oscillospiraceae bacterium]|nr:hypothetical protein [Oscillospiraceae bacterium]